MTFIKILLIIKLVKKLFVLVSGLLAYLFLPLGAFAVDSIVDPCNKGEATGNAIADVLCSLGGDKIGQTVRNIVVFFVILAIVIALMYLLYGGVKWITSKGDKTEVESARNHIMAAIIGLIVVLLAVFIVSVVLTAFGLNFGSLQIPSIGGTTPVTPK